MVRVIQLQVNGFSTWKNVVWSLYMSAWGAGLRLKGSGIFPREEKLSGDCRNYCFNRTTLSQDRRNKLEIVLTGGEKEQWGWSEGREKMSVWGWTLPPPPMALRRGEQGRKTKGGGKGCQCTRQNPEISSVRCLEFPFPFPWNRREAGWDVNLLPDSDGCWSRRDVW